MDLNRHLAAYGLFQHQFAYLDGSLTKAIVALMKCDPVAATKPLSQRLTFGKRLDLMNALNQNLESLYDLGVRVPKPPMQSQNNTEFQELSDWIKKARALSYWRNERVHGRLGFNASTGAAYLVDQGGSALDVDHAICTAKAQEAYQLVDELEDITTRCLDDVELTKKMDSIRSDEGGGEHGAS